MQVIKRDMSVAEFSVGRITAALCKSGVEQGKAEEIATRVKEYFTITGSDSVKIDDIQEVVVKYLELEGMYAIRDHYLNYMLERNQIRKKGAALVEVLGTIVNSTNPHLKENANVNADGPMGKMLKIGSVAAKEVFTYQMPKKYSKAHLSGEIHMHDLEFYDFTTTCCQIDLKKLFTGGFGTGHGQLREPRRIGSYASLACIAIQSNQNDHHGGQSIPCFDYYLAPGVVRTYQRHFRDILYNDLCVAEVGDFENCSVETLLDFSSLEISEDVPDMNNPVFNKILQNGNKLIEARVKKLIKGAHKKALRKTDEDTYQAMEAVVHNLNTMHCLPASERIWVYDRVTGELALTRMDDLHNMFEAGRFFALSLNRVTGVTELKKITNSCRKDNHRRLVKLYTEAGAVVRVTDNHEVLTVEGKNIVDKIPESVSRVITPKTFSLPVIDCDISLFGYGEVYSNTRFKNDSVKMSADLAELFGYYVADGSVSGDASLNFSVCGKVGRKHLSQLMYKVFGVEFENTQTYYENSDGDSAEHDTRFSVGARIARMFKDLCGDVSATKKVPTNILLGTREYKKRFLDAYISCDASRKNYIIASTVSKTLQLHLNLLFKMLGECAHLNSTEKELHILHDVSIGGMAAERCGFVMDVDNAFEIPSYDYSFYRDFLQRGQKYIIPRRRSNAVRHSEVISTNRILKDESLNKFEHIYPVKVTGTEIENSGDEYVYDISVEDNENFLTQDGIFVHNSRAGAQVPFSSLNYGTDTSMAGRLVTKNLLLALESGMGNGEIPIFPIHIFKVKSGVNYEEGTPNHDLFKLACRVTSKRLFPNFSFLDASFNLPYYRADKPETEVAYMGCRTRVIGNVYDPSCEIVNGRGNLSYTSINLPRLALRSGGDMKRFGSDLHDILHLVTEQLLHRLSIVSKLRVKNFPFLMGQGVWIGSENLNPEDEVGEVLKHGTLSIGFIGLAETLVCLLGSHHGQSDEAQRLGLEIINEMRQFCDNMSKHHKLNFTLIATPAEGLSGRFLDIDREKFGVIEGITDHEFYTNSYHVPVYYPINMVDKIKIEAPYHALCNAGHISYVELEGAVHNNPEAIEDIVKMMYEHDIGYGGINHPVDYDSVCNYSGVIGDICPKCGRKENNVPFRRIRRVTGYLSGSLERFNKHKIAEVSERRKHDYDAAIK